MRRLILIMSVILIFNGPFYAVDKIVFTKGFNLEPKMAENEVFLKECSDVEIVPSENVGYFLDKNFGMIFKIDLRTGKLLKTISSKGQGPGELHIPISLQIRNGLIFVLDKGFMGVKIFDLEGKFINCFKLGSVLFGNRNFFVNEKDEIFVGKIDTRTNTMVTVYDLKGNELRSLIPFLEKGEKDNNKNTLERKAYLLSLDSKGNIYILYYVLRDLVKFDKKGNMVWKVHIKNEIFDQYPDEDYAHTDGNTMRMRWSIFNLFITEKNEIVVGHSGGGCIYDEEGKIKKLISTIEDIEDIKNSNLSLTIFRIREGLLINVLLVNKNIYIYPYKEDTK